MLSRPLNPRLPLDVVALLQTLETTQHDERRTNAIEEIASRGDQDVCRILMEAFDRSMWRAGKLAIIRSLGGINQQRGIEFLLRIASDREDLAMASEAVLALGSTGNSVAG